MSTRSPRTAYYLNRATRGLALVARSVRLPASVGTWVPIASGMEPPWKVSEMLAATFPGLDAKSLSFIALLSDDEVDEFEKELDKAGLLMRDLPETG